MICEFVFFGDLKVGLEFILREDQGPSPIEHLFLGYLANGPRKWHGIGLTVANARPIELQLQLRVQIRLA